MAASLASRCTVQLSYAIGRSSPVSVSVDTHGTGTLADHLLARVAGELFDLSPAGNIRDLGLDRPVFLETARRGHFGRAGYAWEGYGKVEELRAWAKGKRGRARIVPFARKSDCGNQGMYPIDAGSDGLFGIPQVYGALRIQPEIR